MKGKLKIVVPVVVLLVLGCAYKFVLSKPSAVAKPRVGEVYVLPHDFVVNLSDDRYAKVSVALELQPGVPLPKPPVAGEGGGEAAPGGDRAATGDMPEEAIVRDIITDTLTDASPGELVNRKDRRALKQRILRAIKADTDVQVRHVLFTDVAVQ